MNLWRSYKFILLLFFCFILFKPVDSQSQNNPVENLAPVELINGWLYRYGDSPLNDAGIPVWIQQDSLIDESWRPVEYKKGIAKPSGRREEKNLWLRIKLPDNRLKNPHIFIENVNFACEVYINGQSVYQSEGLADISRHFMIPTWHLIPVDDVYQNSTLFIRIFSLDPKIISIDKVFLGSKSDFIKGIVADKIQLVIFGFLFIATGLVPLLIFIKNRKGLVYFAFGLFATSMGVWALSDSIKLLQLLFRIPGYIFILVFVAIFMAPVGLCLYFEQIFGAGFKSIIRRLWQMHLIYAITAFLILISGQFPVYMLEIFSMVFFLLFFITLIVLLSTCITSAVRGSRNARIISTGFIFFAGLGIYDVIGGGLELISAWSQVVYPWGMLVFILSLGIVLERQFSAAHQQLREHSKKLEEKVAERTRDLKDRNKTLAHTLLNLRQMQSNLIVQEKMAALGKLTAGVAHEINNPIGVLKSTMDLLFRATAKVKQASWFQMESGMAEKNKTIRDLVAIIEQNSRAAADANNRVTKIVNSLRNFTKLDEAEFMQVDIRDGIESTLTLIQHEKKAGIRIKKEYGEIPKVYCYPGELNQVFMTLITNALEAIDKKGKIIIKTGIKDKNVYVSISDNGTGIAPEQLNTLFDFSLTTKKSRIGVGIGLANAFNIMKKHNGEIKVESKLDKGSVFTLILPINKS